MHSTVERGEELHGHVPALFIDKRLLDSHSQHTGRATGDTERRDRPASSCPLSPFVKTLLTTTGSLNSRYLRTAVMSRLGISSPTSPWIGLRAGRRPSARASHLVSVNPHLVDGLRAAVSLQLCVLAGRHDRVSELNADTSPTGRPRALPDRRRRHLDVSHQTPGRRAARLADAPGGDARRPEGRRADSPRMRHAGNTPNTGPLPRVRHVSHYPSLPASILGCPPAR